MVSAEGGNAAVLSTTDLKEICKIGLAGQHAARSALSFKNLLLVGNKQGLHIFDQNQKFKKMDKRGHFTYKAAHDFGGGLYSMCLLNS